MKCYPQSCHDQLTHKETYFGIDLQESGGPAYKNAMEYIIRHQEWRGGERLEYDGCEENIQFIWDMTPEEFSGLMKPVDKGYEEPDYMGALFFGNFKLEFMGNYREGWYLNLFQYGAEEEQDRAYAYLEDGTPYEERYPVSDEITLPRRRTFKAFAENIERQIIDLLNNHPEFIPDAIKPTIPSNWYPEEREKYLKDFTRIA